MAAAGVLTFNIVLADRHSVSNVHAATLKMLFLELPTEILANLLQMLAYVDILSCREVRIHSATSESTLVN